MVEHEERDTKNISVATWRQSPLTVCDGHVKQEGWAKRVPHRTSLFFVFFFSKSLFLFSRLMPRKIGRPGKAEVDVFLDAECGWSTFQRKAV